MNILVIGGTYFLGRVFVMQAYKEHKLTLLNRGSYSMKEFGVREYALDRNNVEGLKTLPLETYDAVVDFCAYKTGQIKTILEYLPATVKKYVLISTCEVYQREIGGKKTEDTPLSTIHYSGEVGDYIYEKIQLEKELELECKKKEISYAIVRPSFIYGPYNYAPREPLYIKEIVQRRKIPFPINSDGKFQFVYVKDVANAILQIMAKEQQEGKYNVCSNEITTYDSFLEILKKVSKIPFEVEKYTISQILENNLLAPFPLTKEETQLYDGGKLEKEFDFNYTPLEEGMRRTFVAFEHVFSTN